MIGTLAKLTLRWSIPAPAKSFMQRSYSLPFFGTPMTTLSDGIMELFPGIAAIALFFFFLCLCEDKRSLPLCQLAVGRHRDP